MTAILERPITDHHTHDHVPCDTTWIGGECDNPARYAVTSHITPRFHLCAPCWAADADAGVSRCQVTGCVEDRDTHYRITEVLP